MIDRDGVIKALEEAITFVDGRGYGGVAATMHDALELLKEQEKETDRILKVVRDVIYSGVSTDTEPDQEYVYELIRNGVQQSYTEKEQKPLIIRKDVVDEVYDYVAECPECGMTWASWHPDRIRYCTGCGKRVKWNE